MAGSSDAAATQTGAITELTDEERAVLKECSRNSILFRGFPAGILSVLLISQVVKSGFIPKVKKLSGLAYTGLFAIFFYSGVRSYNRTCIAKIMKLENSKLKESVIKLMERRTGKGMPFDGNQGQSVSEQKDLSLPEDILFSAPDESPATGDNIPLPSTTATAPVERRSSSEDVRAPPNLYFDVDEGKENKYASYEELRKKHRERWTPPNMSSVTTRRMEQPRQRREGQQDSAPDSSEAPLSWFDQDNTNDGRSGQESGQRSNTQRERSSYRQGPSPRKNKYGDVME